MALTTTQKWLIGGALGIGTAFLLAGLLVGKDETEEVEYEYGNPEGMVEIQKNVDADSVSIPDAALNMKTNFISPLPAGFVARRPFGYIPGAFDPSKIVFHNGIDFAAPEGTPVLAVDDGIVGTSKAHLASEGKKQWLGGYGAAGEHIWIKHPHLDNLETGYLHLSTRLVEKGAEVKKGQVIGYVGNTGASTSPHLHYGTWTPTRKYINPAPFLPQEALQLRTYT